MPTYVELGNDELAALKDRLEREHAEIKARGLSLNMARGKPAKAQLDLSMPLLDPAIFVILLGGLLLGYDPAVLIVVGIVGYTTWGVLKYIANRQSRE